MRGVYLSQLHRRVCLLFSSSSSSSSSSSLSSLPPPPPRSSSSVCFRGRKRWLSWSDSSAECAYQKALEALERIDRLEQEQEAQKSAKLYEAWQGATAVQTSPSSSSDDKEKKKKMKSSKAGGVVVVKTIAKQARNEQKRKNGEMEKARVEAQGLLERAAYEFCHPQALVRLGNGALREAQRRRKNSNVKKNVAKGEWFGEVGVEAEGGGEGEDGLIGQAMELYERADSGEGWFNLGHMYWTGYPQTHDDDDDDDDDGGGGGDSYGDSYGDGGGERVIVARDRVKALECFMKSIDKGDRDAMYFVGVHHLSEEQSVDDMNQGLELIQQCADLGHPGGLYYIAMLLYNGNDVLGIDPISDEEFVERLDMAADGGDPDALFTRGHGFLHGEDGRAQDSVKALDDFLEAANNGHADGAVSAGAMLHQGMMGIRRDQTRAFELYQLAGELGSKDGWRNVVACYALGEGVKQCDETARYIADMMLKDGR